MAGYLRGSSDFALVGRANPRVDRLTCMCDAGHKGDTGITSKSQSGVIILLNGVPVCWRSNRQCDTSLSPAEGEIYALSVGVKDSRLMGWVLEECGVQVEWPVEVGTDSKAAKSFREASCPESKIRGCFDLRMDWVEELRTKGDVVVRYIEEASHLSDVFTKCMGPGNFKKKINQIRSMWKMVNI